MQSQKPVAAYFTSNQLLPFGFVVYGTRRYRPSRQSLVFAPLSQYLGWRE